MDLVGIIEHVSIGQQQSLASNPSRQVHHPYSVICSFHFSPFKQGGRKEKERKEGKKRERKWKGRKVGRKKRKEKGRKEGKEGRREEKEKQ